MKYLITAIAGLALSGCSVETANTTDTADAALMPNVSATNIEAHIRFLASDYLAGRDAGTDGYEIAANYVAAQMRLLGLEPAGEVIGCQKADMRFNIRGADIRHEGRVSSVCRVVGLDRATRQSESGNSRNEILHESLPQRGVGVAADYRGQGLGDNLGGLLTFSHKRGRDRRQDRVVV